ncbi:MAG: hypothetical protein IT214_14405 [Chitinophagaceae bacterium]|nr:hypothetical protein [Chitinophagaceae bacterium]
MDTAKYLSRLMILSLTVLLFGSKLSAQWGRGYRVRGYHSYYSRPVVSVNLGIRAGYGYYPYYPRVYRYYPPGISVGLRIGTLPFGFNTIYVGPRLFYYYDGIYYRPYGDNEYEVASPPLGAKVPALPGNARITLINGQKYYVSNGTYYKEEITDNNDILYKVVGVNGKLNTDDSIDNDDDDSGGNVQPGNNGAVQKNEKGVIKVGGQVDELPTGSKAVVINMQKYFLDPSGTYYQEVVDGNRIHYKIVGRSSDIQ